jgi:hypothetical protein
VAFVSVIDPYLRRDDDVPVAPRLKVSTVVVRTHTDNDETDTFAVIDVDGILVAKTMRTSP